MRKQRKEVRQLKIQRLKGRAMEYRKPISTLAEKIGIDKSTLYRKLENGGDTITIKEARLIAKELEMNTDEINDIFFGQ